MKSIKSQVTVVAKTISEEQRKKISESMKGGLEWQVVKNVGEMLVAIQIGIVSWCVHGSVLLKNKPGKVLIYVLIVAVLQCTSIATFACRVDSMKKTRPLQNKGRMQNLTEITVKPEDHPEIFA